MGKGKAEGVGGMPVEVRDKVCRCGEAASTQGYLLERFCVRSGTSWVFLMSQDDFCSPSGQGCNIFPFYTFFSRDFLIEFFTMSCLL